MSKTTGLMWTTFQSEWNRNFFVSSPTVARCSYCQTECEPGRERCKTCGAPA